MVCCTFLCSSSSDWESTGSQLEMAPLHVQRIVAVSTWKVGALLGREWLRFWVLEQWLSDIERLNIAALILPSGKPHLLAALGANGPWTCWAIGCRP